MRPHFATKRYTSAEDMYFVDAMMGRSVRLSPAALALVIMPLLIFLGILASLLPLPELMFFAECQNIGNGDVCAIRLKNL